MPASTDPPDRTVPLILAGLAAVVTLMGAVFLAVAWHKERRAEATLSWPSVAAVVTSSGRSDYRQPGESLPDRTASSAGHYTVDGRRYEFTCSGLLAGDSSSAGSPGEAPPESRVRIYYDPGDPSDFVLESERGRRSRAFGIVGAICVLATLPFWWLALRLLRRTRGDGAGPRP